MEISSKMATEIRTVKITNVPIGMDANQLTALLERILREKGSVYASKVLKETNSKHLYTQAIVQLEGSLLARKLCTALSMCSRMKATVLGCDMVSKPRESTEHIVTKRLHFGCQVSHNKYAVLWTCDSEVQFEFASDISKLFIELTDGGMGYRLVLSFSHIRYMHRYSTDSSRETYLVIQVYCAPKIYCKERSHDTGDGSWIAEYSKFGSDNQWVRTTDYTSNLSIGNSSSICLELLDGAKDAVIKNSFYNYKDIRENLSLDLHSPSTSTSRLVPSINPPNDINIPYKILFQVNALVHRGTLSWPTLGREFFKLVEPESEHSVDRILFALHEISNIGPTYRPEKFLKKIIYDKKAKRYADFNTRPDDGLMKVHRVHITPTRIYLFGPEIDVSNRVIRRFSEHTDDFIRVSFTDEDARQLFPSDLCQKLSKGEKLNTKLYLRILSVLKEGIMIGNKKFEFLAFSSSQLRESSLWMFASNRQVTAQNIRAWMGNFLSIRNVAKCAARMGQCFSSSKKTLCVSGSEVEQCNDIKLERDSESYIFSDGIGKISVALAKKLAVHCGCSYVPSAFQIRYGGYKGVVAMDPTSGYKLSLRPSMRKFDSENENIDVLSWTKFRPCFLNRQIITLLSTLGVRDQRFEKLQEEVINRLDLVLDQKDMALEVLQIMSGGENHDVIINMLRCGYSPKDEPYLSMILHAFRAAKLLELKHKARIFVPKGSCLMGCLDEYKILEYGEIFIQVTEPKSSLHSVSRGNQTSIRKRIITGTVIVAKNPCLHPGDVRILTAVDDSRLHHLVNCAVFPQKGERPHPNECSGSDLDGDLYFICWDESLIPPNVDMPMDYVAPPEISLNHPVTIEDIQEFFANYMLNDSLGIISARHTVFADSDEEMARSDNCLKLAQLFTLAVDFPKTGVPAKIPSDLVPIEYPDFMEKEDKPTYISERVIGKLYKAVKDHAMHSLTISSFTREVAYKAYDKDLEVGTYQNYIDAAFVCKNVYDSTLLSIMYRYGITYEAEIVSGNIFSFSKFHVSRLTDIREVLLTEVKSLQSKARSWFEADVRELKANEYELASAWYHITYHPYYWGYGENDESDDRNPHLISFPWTVYDKLLRIKRNKTRGSDPFPRRSMFK